MKTRKITVFAIASILGAIALTSCGRAVETSMNTAKAQPSTEAAQTTEQNAAVSSNTESAPLLRTFPTTSSSTLSRSA